MRQDSATSQITARVREPRIAIGIIYPTGSIYLTNRTGIANVPGNVVHGVITDISSTSQTLYPDQGRSEIGTLQFSAVDLNGGITDEIRDQLLNQDRGIRRREVRVYTGDTDDFNDFTRVETYVVDGVTLDGRTYSFSCSDRSREQRVDIFDQQSTRLASTITDSDTTLTVLSTDGFEMVAHTASFTDSPSATVGYVRIKKTGEIISYTGKTDTTFTGCSRGLFGTIAQSVTVESSDDDRKPEVEEFIYLEMPAPQLDYAIKTGVILGTANTLPDTWHMGIDEAFVDSDQYEAIGADLYDPSDVTEGFILRFTHLKKEDGKRFCEEQLHMPMGTYSPIDVNGVIGIRRVASLLSTAAPVAILFDNNIISAQRIEHSLSKVINRVVINWNYDGENYTRTDLFLNQGSIGNGDTGHGESKPLELNLRGMHVSRHTRPMLQRIFNYLTDRYGAPPIEFEAKLSRSMNALEIGDTVRAVLGSVRDFSALAHLDRAFELQSRRIDWLTGDLSVRLFGSTARAAPDAGGGTGAILDDSFYSAAGTELSTVLTISAGHVTASGTLTGGADLRTSIFYYLGDLTIDSGVTVNIDDNVALFVRGNLTINGKINGKGRGIAATADPNTVGVAYVFGQTTYSNATFGSTSAGSGVDYLPGSLYRNWPQASHNGIAALSRLNLSVESGALVGLPSELRGTAGLYGGAVTEETSYPPIVRAKGGAGGAGGAGLLILCRGLSFGAAGEIDLSGADGASPSGTISLGGHDLYPGAGGGGVAGGLRVILDGDDIPLPDLSAAFTADHGATPQLGNPINFVYANGTGSAPAEPWTGFGGLSSLDMWEAAQFIQYVPSPIPVGASDDEIVPAPTGLAGVGSFLTAVLSWVLPPQDKYDFVEVWRSTTNDRTGAVLVFRGKTNAYIETSTSVVTRYFWIRAGKDSLGYSEWEPASVTGGEEVTYGNQGTAVGWAADSGGKPAGIRALQSIADRSQVSIANGRLRIVSSPDTTVVYGTPAFPINDGKTYQLTVKFLSNAASSDGFYVEAYEYNDVLPSGKTHVGFPTGVAGTDFESIAVAGTSSKELISNIAMSTTATTKTVTYAPTGGARMVSIGFGNYDPNTADTALEIEWAAFTELGSNIDLLPGVRPPIDIAVDGVNMPIFRQSTEPSNPQAGWLWVDSDDDRSYRYDGSSWVFMGAVEDGAGLSGAGPVSKGISTTTGGAWVDYVDFTNLQTGDVVLVTSTFGIEITSAGTAPWGVFAGMAISVNGNTPGVGEILAKTTTALEQRSHTEQITITDTGTNRIGLWLKMSQGSPPGILTASVTNYSIQFGVLKQA